MRLYLDTSIYNRPFDDQSQPKIYLETQAIILVFQMIDTKLVELVSSPVLSYENSRNPFANNQKAMAYYLEKATIFQRITPDIYHRAVVLQQQGIKEIDALHVACCEFSKSDYFLTCDKRLINRCQELTIKVINPIDFILEVQDES
jgi:predicted nucleic acid-binding protein